MEKYYIKIIVEGSEEYTFFDIVKTLGTNEKFYIEIEDATGYGDIADAYLSSLREDMYDCVICVYDVDNKNGITKSPYNITRFRLMAIFQDEEIVDAISFCTNPNILQYILLLADSLEKVALKSTSKTTNTKLVHNYWPNIASGKTDSKGRKIKQNYDASNWQLDIIKYSVINQEYPYLNIFKNAKELPLDYKNFIPAGNLLPLLIALKEGDESFFKRITNLVNSVND